MKSPGRFAAGTFWYEPMISEIVTQNFAKNRKEKSNFFLPGYRISIKCGWKKIPD